MLKFGGYDSALVVTFGQIRFTRVFPCTKHITRDETIKILLEEWFCVHGAPKEINSDEDVGVRSNTGWYKSPEVPQCPGVDGVPHTHTSSPLCEDRLEFSKRT